MKHTQLNMAGQLVWLITGTSSGFGKELALAALRRGDRVIATARARSLPQLADLQAAGADTLELDVVAPLARLHEIAAAALALHGRVDVLVNNAGNIALGALEENTPEETYNQFNTNVFGALNVARAFLPSMRARKSGTVLWLGSLGGWRGEPAGGLYTATKHALRALSEALHGELRAISPALRSVIVELGYFRTEILSPNNRARYVARIADYRAVCGGVEEALAGINRKQPGSPEKAAEIVVDLVRGEGTARRADGTLRPVPLSLQLGPDCVGVVVAKCESTVKMIDEWRDVATATDY